MFKQFKQKRFVFLSAIIVGVLFAAASTTWAAEVKPGDVIDSSNIEQYKEYFPAFMQRYIKDGWGYEKPVVIKVKEREPVPLTKSFLKASQDNQKTCKLNAEGLIEGYSGVGFPFLDPKEPNLAMKCMWNQFYKELPDDWTIPESYLSISKRKGGSVSISDQTYEQLMFAGRHLIAPMPELENPKQLFYANKLNFQTPPNKDMATLSWRYKDPLKYDDMWTYVPTLRRTLRMVSSERANPIRGSAYTWDDIFGFDGKIPLFTYKYLGEQTVLALMNQKIVAEELDRKNYPHHPILHHNEEFETVDCYVIEITAKDARYPSARKVAWVNKDNFKITWAEIYDKTNTFWKGYYNAAQKRTVPTTEGIQDYPITSGSGMTDFKTYYWTYTVTGGLVMNGGAEPSYFAPGALGTF